MGKKQSKPQAMEAPLNTSLPYATDYHAPVLYKAVTDGLVHNPQGVYIDGTLGGGGHTQAILACLDETGKVIGIDQDANAIKTATERIKDKRFFAYQGNFRTLLSLLETVPPESVDGILLDLGISSHQIDVAARGFSYMLEGPLDMRMNQESQLSATSIVNEWDEFSLAKLFWEYGEEPKGRVIARAIIKNRPIATTHQLAAVIETVVRGKQKYKAWARIFQAIRIKVNDELGALEQVLEDALSLLKTGGRLAVISYHSLEDRRVKRFLRFGNVEGKAEKDFYGNLLTPWKIITRKAIVPTPEEIAQNPRARSAKLRIAEKT